MFEEVMVLDERGKTLKINFHCTGRKREWEWKLNVGNHCVFSLSLELFIIHF